MKTRICGVIAGIVVLSLLTVTVTACGGGSKATASTAVEVTTLAGKAGVHGSADGRGASARFFGPQGLARDAAGNMYVADVLNYTIRKVTPSGHVTTLAGKAGVMGTADGSSSAARFVYPNGIACDASGNLYVTDMWRIRKINPRGVVTTLAGAVGSPGKSGPIVDGRGAAVRFRFLEGITRDAHGNLYVIDDTTVRKVAPDGRVTTLAGTPGSRRSADGRGVAARFTSLKGIACDSSGTIYVTDYNAIRMITPAGVVTTLAGRPDRPGFADGHGDAARFGALEGIVCDVSGNVFVADWDNNAIREVSSLGDVTTVVSKASVPLDADGSNTTKKGLYCPEGVAIDSAGNVYISANQAITRITLSH